MTIYLDYAATTPAHPDVVSAMLPYFTENFGNASALYACGQAARNVLEETREKVARFIGARADEVIFTSGGTESDNHALIGVAYANKERKNHIITTAIEHHAVIETCKFLESQGFRITYLPVDQDGLINPDDVRRAITPQTVIVSVMHANNEVGVIEPLSEISRITRERGVYLHTDAVQTVGHLPIDVNQLGVDLLSMSAHKLYGPKGVGALYVRPGTKMISFMHGGGQERGRRAGTENIAGIVGLGKAVEIAGNDMDEEASRLTALRDKLIHGIFEKIGDVHLNGHPRTRLPNNVNVSIESVEGESICLYLDMAGICASTGSACSSGSNEPSHVLLALGMPRELAHGSLRLTLGKWTTEAQIDETLTSLSSIIGRLREISPLYKNRR